jgi:hypothetical protein
MLTYASNFETIIYKEVKMNPTDRELVQAAIRAAQSGVQLTDAENDILNLAFVKAQTGVDLTEDEIQTLEDIIAKVDGRKVQKRRKP